LKSIFGATVIGVIPNVTDDAAVTTLKEKSAEGFENIGKTFPTHGKIIGAGMVLKQVKKLNKKTKSII